MRLNTFFKTNHFDVIGINETELTKHHISGNFKLDGYERYRADRKIIGEKPGGGCALFIMDNVLYNENPELIPEGLEGICDTVTLPNKSKLLVVNIYRRPKVQINRFDKMNTLLENFSTTNLDFIIACDLNCDSLKQYLK